MRTFTESLQVTTNLRMVKESFVLMSERGVDPNDFVEWYTTDGIGMQDKGLLTEASEEWLEGQIANWFRDYAGQKGLGKASNALATGIGGAAGAGLEAAKGLGGAAYDNATAAANRVGGAFKAVTGWGNNPTAPTSGPTSPTGGPVPQAQAQAPQQAQAQAPEPAYAQHAKSAATAVDALSKRMSKSKSLMEKLGGPTFQAAVVNLLNMLKNPSKIAQAASPSPTPASSSADTPSFESTGFGNFTRKIRLQNEIKTGLRTLQEHNIDPVKFVDWYIEEGQYLNEGIFDGAKDWFGRQWANAKGAWGQWGKAGDEYQAQKDQGRDNDAIQQAMHALGELEKGMTGSQPAEDFAAVLNQVQSGLNQASQAPAADQAPAAPAQTPEAEAAPPEQPAAPFDPLQSHIKNLMDVSNADPATIQAEVPKIMASAKTAGVDQNALLSQLKSQGVDLKKLGLPEPTYTPPSDEEWMNTVHGGSSHENRVRRGMPLFFEYLKRRA
jgi:hypothetical protein